MRVVIDGGRCQGTGFCARVAPEYFRVQDSVALVIRSSVAPADEEHVQEAADMCPTRAILVASERPQ